MQCRGLEPDMGLVSSIKTYVVSVIHCRLSGLWSFNVAVIVWFLIIELLRSNSSS